MNPQLKATKILSTRRLLKLQSGRFKGKLKLPRYIDRDCKCGQRVRFTKNDGKFSAPQWTATCPTCHGELSVWQQFDSARQEWQDRMTQGMSGFGTNGRNGG